MQCTSCNSDVVDGAAFCNRCGTALQMICASCQAVNPMESSFCHSCGRSLNVGVSIEEAASRRYEPVTGSAVPSVATTCPRCDSSNEAGSIYCYDCGLPLDDSAAATPSYSRSRMASQAGQPAGFWIRLAAWIIDFIILSIAGGIIVALFVFGLDGDPPEDLLSQLNFPTILLGVLYVTVGVAVWSTTGGKRVLGLYVLRPDGSKVGVGRAFARYFAHTLSAMVLFTGHLLIAIREDKRGLHDLICDTVVVKR
ncbi:MAG: RDD family protein [Chloroflexi bacterium]|nr:RDD family protein [Chloroflexota bacterium]